MTLYLVLLQVALLFASAAGVDYTWVGSHPWGEWDVDENWSPKGWPGKDSTTTDTATITHRGEKEHETIAITPIPLINKLTLAKITVSAGVTLEIGDINVDVDVLAADAVLLRTGQSVVTTKQAKIEQLSWFGGSVSGNWSELGDVSLHSSDLKLVTNAQFWAKTLSSHGKNTTSGETTTLQVANAKFEISGTASFDFTDYQKVELSCVDIQKVANTTRNVVKQVCADDEGFNFATLDVAAKPEETGRLVLLGRVTAQNVLMHGWDGNMSVEVRHACSFANVTLLDGNLEVLSPLSIDQFHSPDEPRSSGSALGKVHTKGEGKIDFGMGPIAIAELWLGSEVTFAGNAFISLVSVDNYGQFIPADGTTLTIEQARFDGEVGFGEDVAKPKYIRSRNGQMGLVWKGHIHTMGGKPKRMGSPSKPMVEIQHLSMGSGVFHAKGNVHVKANVTKIHSSSSPNFVWNMGPSTAFEIPTNGSFTYDFNPLGGDAPEPFRIVEVPPKEDDERPSFINNGVVEVGNGTQVPINVMELVMVNVSGQGEWHQYGKLEMSGCHFQTEKVVLHTNNSVFTGDQTILQVDSIQQGGAALQAFNIYLTVDAITLACGKACGSLHSTKPASFKVVGGPTEPSPEPSPKPGLPFGPTTAAVIAGLFLIFGLLLGTSGTALCMKRKDYQSIPEPSESNSQAQI